MQFVCECGQQREISATSHVGHDGNAVVMPCCLRRYRIIGWNNGPVLECIGIEDWRSGKLVIREKGTKEFKQIDKRKKQRIIIGD